MKISGFKIEQFAKSEYTDNQTPEMQDLNSDSLLITGPNRSGKSLTFNAILYGLLGREEVVGVRTGGGNKVWLTFDDGSRMFRGEPHRVYETVEEEYETEEADIRLHEQLGDVKVLKRHFLHSHMDELPLEDLRKNQRLSLIRTVTNRSAKNEIEELETHIQEIEDGLIKKRDKLSPLKKRKKRLELQTSQFEGQKSDWETLVELTDSGRLTEIKSTLEQHESIQSELEELSSKRTGLRRKITSKEKELGELQRYEQEVEDIIIEAMREFVCPVCDGRVDSKEAGSRMRQNKCPFCKQDHSIQDLKNHLQKEKAQNKGRPGKLTVEVSEHKTELSKIDSQISELEDKVPEISELNDLAVSKLKNGDQTIDEIATEAREELASAESSLSEVQEQSDQITNRLSELRQTISALEDEKDEAESSLSTLRSESNTNDVSRFIQTWNHHFGKMAGDLGLSLNLLENDGSVRLPGGEDGPRQYERRGDLSDSEVQLLNISFALALNEHAVDSGVIDWNCLVLDEPFTHLDDDTKQSALEYLLGIHQQVILTSSDDYVCAQFDAKNTLELVRQEYSQTTFNQGEWSA